MYQTYGNSIALHVVRVHSMQLANIRSCNNDNISYSIRAEQKPVQHYQKYAFNFDIKEVLPSMDLGSCCGGWPEVHFCNPKPLRAEALN